MAGNDSKPQLDISAEDDWKSRVKAQDAALDEQFRSGTADSQPPNMPEATAASGTHPDLPEATFDLMVAMLATQALMGLGVVPNPGTGKPEADLPLAQHFIDLLTILQTKTAGNLSAEEAEGLEQTLHQLRIGYVQRSRANA